MMLTSQPGTLTGAYFFRGFTADFVETPPTTSFEVDFPVESFDWSPLEIQEPNKAIRNFAGFDGELCLGFEDVTFLAVFVVFLSALSEIQYGRRRMNNYFFDKTNTTFWG